MSIVSRFVQRDGPHPADLTLEAMRKRHLRAVLAIERQSYPKPWTIGVFQSEIDLARDDRRYYVVAKQAHAVVGYAGLLYSPEGAHVTNIAVDPRLRRGGIGRRLLLDLVREARRARCTSMTLEVRVSNVAAQEMYRAFGFVPAGIRHNYYENTDDAIVMWLHDIDSDEYAARIAEIEAAT
ncbi:MAG: ribosomal protein S18-alanine N-acetyltransferase [Ilumatobacteraceae bacterium]